MIKQGDKVVVVNTKIYRGDDLNGLTGTAEAPQGKNWWGVMLDKPFRGDNLLFFRTSELMPIRPNTSAILEELRAYAETQGFTPVKRQDGTFYLKDDKGREVYSVILDPFVDGLFETWNFKSGGNGWHRARNLESVKRSLRRFRPTKTKTVKTSNRVKIKENPYGTWVGETFPCAPKPVGLFLDVYIGDRTYLFMEDEYEYVP